MLEVAALWGDTLMSVKHYARGAEPVTLGAGYGHRWRVLGSPVAWVPSAFARVAWLAAPTISEASEEWRSEFYVPETAVPQDDFPLFAWSEGAWVCRFSARWSGFLDLGEQRRSLADLVASGQARRVEGDLYEVELGEELLVSLDRECLRFQPLTVVAQHPGVPVLDTGGDGHRILQLPEDCFHVCHRMLLF